MTLELEKENLYKLLTKTKKLAEKSLANFSYWFDRKLAEITGQQLDECADKFKRLKYGFDNKAVCDFQKKIKTMWSDDDPGPLTAKDWYIEIEKRLKSAQEALPRLKKEVLAELEEKNKDSERIKVANIVLNGKIRTLERQLKEITKNSEQEFVDTSKSVLAELDVEAVETTPLWKRKIVLDESSAVK